MRYVAKTLSDRIFHLADEPHVRSYCRKLRGDLVVVDVDYASERIADRTAKVCAACRTVLDDRRAAERAMNDNFMITDVEKRPRPRPAVEPALFDLGDDQALPVVDAAAVIAAGVPVVDATPTGEESSHLSGARQVGGSAGLDVTAPGETTSPTSRAQPAAHERWENGRPGERAKVTTADARDYAVRFPQSVEVRDRFERYEGEFRRSPMLSTVHVAGVEFPARWMFDDKGGITITMPDSSTYWGHWNDIARTVRAYVLANRPEMVVAVGEAHERAEQALAARRAEYAAEEAAGLRALDAVRTDANRARVAFEALRPALSHQTDEVEDAAYDIVNVASSYAEDCERERKANTYRWWVGMSSRVEEVRRAADWLTRAAKSAGVTVPPVPAVVSVAPDAAPGDPGAVDTWEGDGGACEGVNTPRGPEAGPGGAPAPQALDAPVTPGDDAPSADLDYEAIAAGLALIRKANRTIEARRGAWTDKPGADWHVKQSISGYEGTPTYMGTHGTAALYATDDGTAYQVCVYTYAGKQAHEAVRKTLDAAFKLGQKLANQELPERSRPKARPAGETTMGKAEPEATAEFSDVSRARQEWPWVIVSDVTTEAVPVDVWEGEGGAVPGVDTPAPATAATAPMPIDWAKPAGRGDCAAANRCGGFGVLLWDVPGCAPRCTECAARIMGHTPAALRALTLPGDVVTAEEQAEAADVVIRHTHEDGTTVEGSSKGDGVWEALRPLGWAYRRTPGIFIRGSRYKGADRWKIDRAADAVRALGMSCAVVIEENMSFAEREAARVETAEDRAVRFADRAGRAAASSQAARDTSDRIGERFWMGQPILIGHHSEGRARRDQERMHNAMRKSIAESERAGYWADRAAASEAYERYRKNPGRTLRRIEELEAERRGVLRERDGVDDKGRQADVWRREPSTARRGELTRRLAEYDEELTYWAETIKEAERRGFKVWGRADFVKGDFAWWRGTWYEVTRVNAKTVTVPHIHAAFDGGAVGAVDGCRVVTRAATQETRHQGSTYTLPYNEVSRRMSAEQMRAALAGETIPADPRDATPEPAHEGAEAEQTAELQDQADPAPVDSGLVHSSESEFSRERPEAPRAASAALTVADVGTGPADVAAGERTTTLPITDKKLPVARADLGGAKPLPATGVEALTAAGVPMVGGCCSCGAAIERPLNGPRPACTHEGATHPDGSVVVGGYRVTPKGHGRCLTDHHDIEGVALYEARNTVARCGGCVAADLGVDPSALPAIPEFSNMSGAQQTPKSAAAATRADTIPADIRAMEEEWRRRSPNPAGGILRVPLAETRPAEPAGPAAPEADLTLF